jgi:hypothetical protein
MVSSIVTPEVILSGRLISPKRNNAIAEWPPPIEQVELNVEEYVNAEVYRTTEFLHTAKLFQYRIRFGFEDAMEDYALVKWVNGPNLPDLYTYWLIILMEPENLISTQVLLCPPKAKSSSG